MSPAVEYRTLTKEQIDSQSTRLTFELMDASRASRDITLASFTANDLMLISTLISSVTADQFIDIEDGKDPIIPIVKVLENGKQVVIGILSLEQDQAVTFQMVVHTLSYSVLEMLTTKLFDE